MLRFIYYFVFLLKFRNVEIVSWMFGLGQNLQANVLVVVKSRKDFLLVRNAKVQNIVTLIVKEETFRHIKKLANRNKSVIVIPCV